VHRNNNINNNIDTKEKICISVKDISSNLVSVSKYDSIKDAIDIMINRGIRNIGIKNQNSDLIGVINDRTILEFLLSPRWRLKEIIDSIKQDSETTNNESTQINIKEVIADSNHSNDDIGRIPSINSIINDLHIIPISEVKVEENTTISKAAELLMEIHNPCLVLQRENAIVTPWDIVMKTAEFSNK
jgi:CBS domain-containing protein